MNKAKMKVLSGWLLTSLCLAYITPFCFALEEVSSYEGVVEIPTYEFTGREKQPPLFGNSTVGGKYPFPPYIRPFKAGGPSPKRYKAVFLENEYLRLTYLPAFGGRFYSLYDKVADREVFYHNDVIKPAGYNPKSSFALFGVELTGPYDTHALTLHGEPFWSHKVVPHEDGSVSLVLGNIDPVYRMKVNFSGRLYPGLAALQLKVSCYNTRDGQQPYMFWISGSLPSTEKTRFIYPMTRTIGHTTSEVADWPFYGDVDYSWDRNNKHMLGVFGIDIYDDFQGAYHHDLDYGVFRYADRKIVQGMKMWTFGYSDRASNLERAYTDNGGPYIEIQSGRHVWDGHYEWLSPNRWEGWSEWWFPVRGIDGLTTTSRDVALKLIAEDDRAIGSSRIELALSPNGSFQGARVQVRAGSDMLLDVQADLTPGQAFKRTIEGIKTGESGLRDVVVMVADTAGRVLLEYRRPNENPGRIEYTPFTRPLEKPKKPAEEMTVEELVLEAEFKLKQMNLNSGMDLLRRAIALDDGNARALLLLGIYDYNENRYRNAAEQLERAVERDPYLGEAYYYLALARYRLGESDAAERCLYYIMPESSFYPNREYLLARMALAKGDSVKAAEHLREVVASDSRHLNARFQLAVLAREARGEEAAIRQLEAIERLDPSSRLVVAERYFRTGEEGFLEELLRLLGGQSQEALEMSWYYARIERWNEAAKMLEIVDRDNSDPWGTPAVFYYTLAHFQRRLGDYRTSTATLEKARAAASAIDRFPFREETETVLREAIKGDPEDSVARFNLGCLLYHFGRPDEAIEQWQKAVSSSPSDFGSLRALGLACAEQGHGMERAAKELESAIRVNPAHVRTFNDLSTIYARAGRFDRQMDLLKRALQRSPGDDNLIEGLVASNLIMGNYERAEELMISHQFQPRHRTYHLRDKYRFLRYGFGTRAFNSRDYGTALEQFRLALKPPVSLGMDDFQFETTPRVSYYVGRSLESLGEKQAALEAYGKSLFGLEHLSGDRDSWNSENFHMVLSLEKLDRKQEARELAEKFEAFAISQLEGRHLHYRSEARYLLALVKKYRGDHEEARSLLSESLTIQPDLLGPRYELRGDTLDPLSNIQ